MHDWRAAAALLGLTCTGAALIAQELNGPYIPMPANGIGYPSPAEVLAPAPVPAFSYFRPAIADPAEKSCKYCWQEKFLGFPEEFEEPPLGHFVNAHAAVQITNAEAARMVLHQYDFFEGSDQLNGKGLDRLAQIAGLLPVNFCPVIIERTPAAPGLAEARRINVLQHLCQGPFPVPVERVVVGVARATDLRGPEAVEVYENLLLQTRNGGAEVIVGRGSSMSGATPGSAGAARAPTPAR